MVGMTMIFYWSCLALLDLWSALLTLCVALLLVESPYPDHFFCPNSGKKMVNEDASLLFTLLCNKSSSLKTKGFLPCHGVMQ